MGLILMIVGALILVFGLINHFTLQLGTGIEHLNLYLTILGVVVLAIGGFMWYRGRSAAA